MIQHNYFDFLTINNPLIIDCCKESVNVNYSEMLFANAHTSQLIQSIQRWSTTLRLKHHQILDERVHELMLMGASYGLQQSNLSELSSEARSLKFNLPRSTIAYNKTILFRVASNRTSDKLDDFTSKMLIHRQRKRLSVFTFVYHFHRKR